MSDTSHTNPAVGTTFPTFDPTPRGTQPLRTFAGISPSRYQHPFDAAALRALSNSSGIDMLISAFVQHCQERSQRIENIANNIRVSTKQLPGIHAIFTDCCSRLGTSHDIELYVAHGFNAWTSGVDQPYVAIGVDLLAHLTASELRFVLGHELGHVLMRHGIHHQIALAMTHVGLGIPLIADIPLVGGVINAGLRLAIMKWHRVSELSSDRAGLLACQDDEAAARALAKLSGFPMPFIAQLSVEGIAEQGEALEELSEKWIDAVLRQRAEGGRSHPWTVLRVTELSRWRRTASYADILSEAIEATPDSPLRALSAPSAGYVCPVCKKAVVASHRFCSQCGSPVGERERQVPATSPDGGILP